MPTENITVTIGTRLSPEEGARLDPRQVGLLLAGTPATAEVEGQAILLLYTRCPWCGHVGRQIICHDTSLVCQGVRCGSCGGWLRR